VAKTASGTKTRTTTRPSTTGSCPESAQKKFERKQSAERAVAEAQQKAQQSKQSEARQTEVVTGALKEGKVPVNDMTLALSRQIIDQHRQLDIQLTGAELVREVGRRYRDARMAEYAAMDDGQLAEEFGPDFRARLRKLETELAKAHKKEAAARPDELPVARPKDRPTQGLTEAQIRKQFKLGAG
jgi:hypothetical protein